MRAPSQGETVLFRIPGDPKYVSTVRRAVQSIAHSLGFPEELAEDIELSVAEALANAVEHGSPEQNRNSVVVVCRVKEDSLEVDVRDQGPGFDLAGFEEGCDLWNEHGRGLRMIYRLMDRVRVCHTPRGSRIRMVKNKQHARKRQRTSSPRSACAAGDAKQAASQ